MVSSSRKCLRGAGRRIFGSVYESDVVGQWTEGPFYGFYSGLHDERVVVPADGGARDRRRPPRLATRQASMATW